MRRFALRAAFLLFIPSTMLGGCGSLDPSTAVPPSANAELAGLITVISTVKIGPIWGPPKATSAQMIRMLDSAAIKAEVALLNYDNAESDYVLRGDLHAARYGSKIRVTYNWYVLDHSGREVGRKTGMEIADTKGASGNPWADLPEDRLREVAEKGIIAVLDRK